MGRRKTQVSIKGLTAPMEVITVPIFSVLIGLQVKLESFLSIEVLTFGRRPDGGGDRWQAGLRLCRRSGPEQAGNRHGMLPRGEVGLIFANIGKALGVINSQSFSAIVLMVVITTVIAPSMLQWSLCSGVMDNKPA